LDPSYRAHKWDTILDTSQHLDLTFVFPNTTSKGKLMGNTNVTQIGKVESFTKCGFFCNRAHLDNARFLYLYTIKNLNIEK
jgi:hypothetical protein